MIDHQQIIDFNWYKGNLNWLKDRTIFLTRSGSHAYGTNTAESDEDFCGVAIAPKEYYLGFLNKFEVSETKGDPDIKIYDIRFFVELAAQCNPNITELLYTDPIDWLIPDRKNDRVWHWYWYDLYNKRDLFLSKEAKARFTGYAISQLKRIKSHRSYLLNPIEKQPQRKEFGLPERKTIDKEQFNIIESRIRKLEDKLGGDGFTKDKVELVDESLVESVIKDIEIDTKLIPIIIAERKYNSAMRNWNKYQEWKAGRNPKRAELEKRYGYDCYSDDTEFLTDNGFKKFDDITENDKLATVYISNTNKFKHFGSIEYQNYIDKFDSLYNGSMYQLSGTHLDTMVTANHKMLIQKVERKSKKEYSWELVEAAHLPDTFNVMASPCPATKKYQNKHLFADIPIPDTTFMTLMGWYLSDGCASIYHTGKNKSISISQVKSGPMMVNLSKFFNKYNNKIQCSLYKYNREPNSYNSKYHVEKVLNIRDEHIVNKIISDCGRTELKHIPKWVYSLSKRLMEHLMWGLLAGDGTIRAHKTKSDSFIYYSKLKSLADDVQLLGVMCGWETALWGPFESTDVLGNKNLMYQVHLRPDMANKQLIRNKNVSKLEVKNQRIVCFTVPNGTLVTRRNGKIGIHGNCKHAMHLIRLLNMGVEILRDGRVLTKRPDAEFLMSIRNGAYNYDQLMDMVAKLEVEINLAYENSKLPANADKNKINKLLVDILENSFE